jgi:hypothetical protein
MEKKYFVIKMYKYAMPVVIESFSNEGRAKTYAEVLSLEKNESYAVVEVISQYNIEKIS